MVYYKLILDTRRKRTDSIYPVVIRITFNRTHSTISTGVRLKEQHWDSASQLVSKNNQNFQSINKSISDTYLKVQKAILKLQESNEFSFEKLRIELSDKPIVKVEQISFYEFSNKLIVDMMKEEYPYNVQVNELPGFNKVTREVYQRLEYAGKHLLRAIAVYLNLPENYFDDKVHNGNSILRAIHYFPIENPDSLPADAVRAGAHEDINLITLLIGASADGLEVLTRDGRWYPVKANVEDIVVNVGDMLQRLTNNKLKSTTHRVVNPPRELMKTSRFSVPFFLHPKADMDLTALNSCIDAEHPKAYTDITAGEYLDERLREIGLKM